MKLRSKFWLEDDAGEAVFGEGRRRILELIDELGSMQATAKALGMSYRGVWARVKTTEERLGAKLVETSVGRGKNRNRSCIHRRPVQSGCLSNRGTGC